MSRVQLSAARWAAASGREGASTGAVRSAGLVRAPRTPRISRAVACATDQPGKLGAGGVGGNERGRGLEPLSLQVPTPENRVRALGLDIPAEVAPAAHYALATSHGGLLYLSGQLPRVDGTVAVTGRVGEDVQMEQACHAARLCMLRALGALRQVLGSLDCVERVLKLQVFVQCAPDFQRHSEVADAASELLVQVFGAVGLAARTAVGVFQLPQGASVELDLVVAASAPVTTSKEPQHALQR